MADDQSILDESDDDAARRGREHLDRLGIPANLFVGVLDAAILHASDPARADAPPVALPWITMGPRNIGGRIGALAQDPRAPATIYAGSGFGGLWKTVNAGDTWTPLDDFRPPNPPNAVRQALPIGAIAIAPSNRQVIYVGTGEPRRDVDPGTGAISDFEIFGTGLYRSTDGGTTFNLIDRVAADGVSPSVIQTGRFETILVDPWEPRRLWIACPQGLWRGEPPAGGLANAAPAFHQDDVVAAGSDDVTDIVIDFGVRSAARDFDPAIDHPPAQFTVCVALRSVGIFRRTFNRAAVPPAYTDDGWEKLTNGLDEVNVHRIKLAMCASQPKILYAVFGLRDRTASHVYKSTDGGDQWEQTAGGPNGDQSYYTLMLAAHPELPQIVFTGGLDVFRSMDGGRSWDKKLDSENYDKGDRAQHADQHAFLFDGLEPRKVWVGNDGGISMSGDLGTTWRKRSHGILATQFKDITVHPNFPFITGGGLQDIGSWVSFGGPTWYYLFGGDGGAVAFDPTNPQRYLVTWQGYGDARLNGVERSVVTNPVGPPASPDYLNPLPDVPAPSLLMQSSITDLVAGFQAGETATFVGVLEHHPTVSNHALVGRFGGAYLSTNWTGAAPTFSRLSAGVPLFVSVSAIAYAPSAPNTDWWIGTNQGQVFMTTAGSINPANPAAVAAIAWNPMALPGIGASWISDIAVHPSNPAIVAVAVAGTPGQIFLSGDRGVTWQEISGRSAPLISAAGDQLTTSPSMCVAFDPRSPFDVGTAQTLYVGTLAGVYVIRNALPFAPPGPPPPTPVWRTFNNGLPLVLVSDIAPIVERNPGPLITRAALRCATLGRGIYECDLEGTPTARLFIRKTPIDDGRTYAGTALLTTDPRQAPMPALLFNQAFDIRVAAPPFTFFEEVMDGVEFDEQLRSDQPKAGERNLVYVQVHTGGTETLAGVLVNLYFADAAAAPAGAAWQAVGPSQSVTVGPAQPAVARFDWAPSNTPNPVALLAVCTHPRDLPAPALPPALVMNPADPVSIATERRAALRITAVTPFIGDVYIRDGVDDDGSAGSVAWSGRCPDIIVLQAAEANPDATFTDLADRRVSDRVKGGVTNHIYVRVHNRFNVPLSANVELYQVPFTTMHQGNTWVQIGASVGVDDIPAKGWKFAPVFQLVNPPDPDTSPSNPYKVFLLVAVVSRADDPKPDITTVTNQDLFWRFFLRDSIGNNAALRALRFEP